LTNDYCWKLENEPTVGGGRPVGDGIDGAQL